MVIFATPDFGASNIIVLFLLIAWVVVLALAVGGFILGAGRRIARWASPMTTPEPQTAEPKPERDRFACPQFSLRRLLLAVAIFAAMLGMFKLHAKRAGMFESGGNSSLWWIDVAVTAFAASSLLLVEHRRDFIPVINAIVWSIVGFIVGWMFYPQQPLDSAISGGVICGLIGWVVSHLCPRRQVPQR